MSTRASSGRASSRMRPFGMAMISGFVMMRALYLRARKRATRGCLDSDALSACQFHHILPCHATGSAAAYGGPLHRLMRIEFQAIMPGIPSDDRHIGILIQIMEAKAKTETNGKRHLVINHIPLVDGVILLAHIAWHDVTEVRKSGVSGKSGTVRLDLGCRRILQ